MGKVLSIRELRLGVALMVVGMSISAGIFWLTSDSRQETSSRTVSQGVEQPASMVFGRTDDYIVGDSKSALVVHAFRITPDYLSVTYTLSGSVEDPPSSVSLRIVDDAGHAYETQATTSFGSVDGVLGGVLVVESHIRGGSLLSIHVDALGMSSGQSKIVDWSIPFLNTRQPDEPITFIEGGRLSAEEGTTINGARVGIAGPPGGRLQEILVSREGRGSSLFGEVDQDGRARALSAEEFEAITGAPGFVKPFEFPWPQAQSR